jgi:polyisoprenoid-binding protein YceI
VPWYPTGVALRTLLAGLLVALLATASPAGSRQWMPVPDRSAVEFSATHPLGDFTGRAEGVTGEFQADPADLKVGVTGVLRVRVAALRTGEAARDRDMRKLLEADKHPEIRYTVSAVEGSFNSMTPTADVLLTIKGGMFIHGVERPMTFLGRARLRDDRVWVRGESRLRLTDFGVTPPSRLFFKVGDEVLVSFDVTLEHRD